MVRGLVKGMRMTVKEQLRMPRQERGVRVVCNPLTLDGSRLPRRIDELQSGENGVQGCRVAGQQRAQSRVSANQVAPMPKKDLDKLEKLLG